jgi:hypothetical protein
MDISEKLARMCITAKMQKQAAGALAEAPPAANPNHEELAKTRSKFETLAAQEEIARRHAARLHELADSRASDEDTSTSGYISTGVGRTLIPIPQTLGEAAIRGGAAIAGGVYGHHLAKKYAPVSGDVAKKLFMDSKFQDRLSELEKYKFKQHFQAPAEVLIKHKYPHYTPAQAEAHMGRLMKLRGELAQNVVNSIGFKSPELIAEAFSENKWFGKPSPEAMKIRDDLVGRYGPGAVAAINNEARAFKPGDSGKGKKDAPPQAAYQAPKYKWLGPALGMAGGAVLSGIPFAARALWRKSEGGEAAVRARLNAQDQEEEAQRKAQERDELIKKLPTLKKASVTGPLFSPRKLGPGDGGVYRLPGNILSAGEGNAMFLSPGANMVEKAQLIRRSPVTSFIKRPVPAYESGLHQNAVILNQEQMQQLRDALKQRSM